MPPVVPSEREADARSVLRARGGIDELRTGVELESAGLGVWRSHSACLRSSVEFTAVIMSGQATSIRRQLEIDKGIKG